MTFETYNYHQQLAKKFFKFANKFANLKASEKQSEAQQEFKDQYSYVISGLKQNLKLTNNYKEDILKW
jgi:hypothetical protein